VGIFDKLAGWLGTGAPTSTSPGPAAGVRSALTAGNLVALTVADVFGLDARPVSRAEAMAVPAIARARHLLTSDAARCPLEALNADGTPHPAPWLQATSLRVSPQHRAVWTVDDLIFHGWSLWIASRESDDIADAARVPFSWWRFGEGGTILVNDQPVPAGEAILIPGYHEGIIADAPETIRGSRMLEEAWQDRAANPIPAVELHQTTADTMTGEEVDALVDNWTDSLRARGGAVGWTPMSIDVRTHGEAATDLLIQGRNAAAVDSARIVGVPAAMIDASNVNASLTYETLGGRNLEYVDRSLALYLGPIESRLSLDDVCPPGVRVRANTSALTAATSEPTGHPTGD